MQRSVSSATSSRNLVFMFPSLLRCWASKTLLLFLISLFDLSIKNVVCIAVTFFIYVCLSVYKTYLAFRETVF